MFQTTKRIPVIASHVTQTVLPSQDCEHSVVQLTRPVKLRRTPFRSRQSLRASIIYKGPVEFGTRLKSVDALPSADDRGPSPVSARETAGVECGSAVNGHPPRTDDGKEQGNTFLALRFIFNSARLKFQHEIKAMKTINIEQLKWRWSRAAWGHAEPCTTSRRRGTMS